MSMSVWRKGSARLPGLGRLAAALVLVLGMVCLLPACGTSDGLDEKAESFDYSHIRTNPDVVALLPKDIKDSGELTIGTNAIYAPAEYTGEDTKTIMGYEIDIARGLGKVMGLRVRPIESKFDNIIPAMGSKFDLGMSAFTITAEREKSVNFVQHYRAGLSFVVTRGNPRKLAVGNLCGATASVQTGTAQEESILAMARTCKAQGKATLTVKSYADQASATIALVNKQVDLMYTDTPVAAYAVKQTDGALQLLGRPQEVAPMGIVIAKDNMKLTKAVQAALQKLIDSGVYKAILDKWGVASGAVTKAVINPDLTSGKADVVSTTSATGAAGTSTTADAASTTTGAAYATPGSSDSSASSDASKTGDEQ